MFWMSPNLTDFKSRLLSYRLALGLKKDGHYLGKVSFTC